MNDPTIAKIFEKQKEVNKDSKLDNLQTSSSGLKNGDEAVNIIINKLSEENTSSKTIEEVLEEISLKRLL